MIWLFFSVVVASAAAIWWKYLDNHIQGIHIEPRTKALEGLNEFLKGQMGATQRALVKVDNKLVKLAQAMGKQEMPTEIEKHV